MARFDTLNPDTQDQVLAMLPAIAKAFRVHEVKDIIPEDIRMRAWDCERRDHIKDKTEDDPRNWGVQFLKDLQAIARLLNNDLAQFQEDLRVKVEKHADAHPWCRLADIKELKVKYLNPGVPSEDDRSPEEYVEDSSSEDSYFEELVEQEPPKGTRRRRNHEAYEVRRQNEIRPKPISKKRKRQASSRLRRDSEGWERPEKSSRDRAYRSVEDRAPSFTKFPRAPSSQRAGSSLRAGSTFESPSYYQPDVPLESQKLQAELEVAEAELNYARLRVKFFEAKKKEGGMALEEGFDHSDSHQEYLG
ncbi:hypothetical protein DM02DRAFT_683876 [Periconia macrospinosa]|uniref:Uncharacterized protein n=1 Tax=Periconia macrospinosa TaxID=97972 RepID=A0A2V1DHY0_9PLEO|nr:hypothetical protein DM02DRAFT_683876 [Periconia macrospinosa]